MARESLGLQILILIFDGFWRSLAPRTRGNRFPVSKSPSLANGGFIASNLMVVFQKNFKKLYVFLVFVYFLSPLEALWSRHWYSD